MGFEADTRKKCMSNLLNLRAGSLAGILAAGMFAAACNNSPDNVKTADSANNSKIDSLSNKQSVTDSSAGIPSKQDAAFMVKATSGSQLEVILGQLTLTNASSPAVKRFGAMMIRDHADGEKQLRGLAAGKRIILPDTISNEQKKEHDELQKKTGRSFDQAYVKLMVSDHKDDISEFQKASQNANDPDIKALAAKLLPVLQEHLDSVEAIEKRGK
jgi:putative membrane protein